MTQPTTDTDLRDRQYGTPANLGARVAIHQRFSTNTQGFHRWLWDQAELHPGDRVLELGCGEGNFWAVNADRVPPDLDLTLTDFSPGMLAATEIRLRPILPEATFTVVDAQAIPDLHASFDVVIANHMLYHVPDKDRALAGIRRVLGAGGRLVAATNGDRHMQDLADLVERHQPGTGIFTMDASFSLENGAEIVGQHFATVQRREYADGLAVTDAGAIIAYIRSSSAAIGDDTLAAIRAEVIATIQDRGAFPIGKSTGCFLGSV